MGQRAFPAVKKRKACCRNCAKGLESVGLGPRSEGLWTANGSKLSSTHLFPQWKSGGKINIEHFPNNVMFEQSQSYLANMAPGVENCINLHTIFPTNAAGGREQWREEIFTFLSTFFEHKEVYCVRGWGGSGVHSSERFCQRRTKGRP